MRKNISIVIALLCMFVQTAWAQFSGGSGTQADPYQISLAADWLTMAHHINNDDNGTYNNKYYKLMADISVTETIAKGAKPVSMIGIGDEHSFKGTFDGDGHTITLNITDNREEHYCGPFRIISGATIKNLHVAGTIVKATWKHAGGIAGKALGNNYITNCRSSVDIQVNTDGDCSSGGFIGDLRDGTTVLTGCLFDGKLRGPGGIESQSTKWGGFIGWVADGRKAILNTCVFAPAEINIKKTSDCRTFARRDDGDDVTLNKCYYLQILGSAQGKQAYSIVAGEHVIVDFEYQPVEPSYSVSGIVFYRDDAYFKAGGKFYSFGGKRVHLNLQLDGETPEGYTAGSYIAIPGPQLQNLGGDWFMFEMPNSDVTISLAPADFITGHDGTSADPYLIYTEEQWAQLVSRVNNGENSGYSGKHFRLMSDITLTETYSSGTSTVMMGLETNDNTKFRGTFDGNGHTITLNLTDNKGDNYCGLFRFIKDATIKKLHVAGTITKSSGKYIGGLVGKAEGLNNTIRSCHSSVDIQSNRDGDVSSGGFIGDVRGVKVQKPRSEWDPIEYDYPVTTFTDCLFDGKLRGSQAYCWGGFVGYAAEDNRLYFNNCLFNPAEVSIDTNDDDDNSRTLARMYESSDVNIHPSNTYYKYSIKETQGALSVGSMSNDELADALGTGWNIFDDEVQPIMGLYALDGKGTQASPYIIATTADWNGLVTNVYAGETYNGKYIQLSENITVSRMVASTAEKCFQGYFDGAGNKLTFNCEGHKSNVAPFGYVNGATFENLHIAGTIHSSGYQIAGLICRAQGENYIRNCRNSIIFDAAKGPGNVDGESYGGYIMAVSGGTTVFTGCIFDGSFASTTNYGPKNSAGFVSLMGSALVQINDCLFAPASADVDVTTFENFVRNPLGAQDLQLNNSYYITNVGGEQGKKGIEIIAVNGITMEGYGVVTEYDVSGITGYLIGVKYGDYLYAPSNEEVYINLDYDRPGYTATGYNVLGAGTLTGTESPYILTITDPSVSSVTIYATEVKNTLNLLDNADNSTAITAAAANSNTYDVTLSGRTLFKDGSWNTLCLPFSLSTEQIAAHAVFAGATLMTLDVTEENGFDTADGTLYLWFKSATAIEAGVPYLVKWEKAMDYEGNEANYDISNPEFEGVTVSSTAAQTVESTGSGLEPVQMVGCYSPFDVTANDKSILFLGDDNTLYYSSTDRKIRSCRAYFSVPYIKGNAGAMVRAFVLNLEDDEATGILEVSADSNQKKDDAWYSLDGVRLSGKPTQCGMYINKGKKILVK